MIRYEGRGRGALGGAWIIPIAIGCVSAALCDTALAAVSCASCSFSGRGVALGGDLARTNLSLSSDRRWILATAFTHTWWSGHFNRLGHLRSLSGDQAATQLSATASAGCRLSRRVQAQVTGPFVWNRTRRVRLGQELAYTTAFEAGGGIGDLRADLSVRVLEAEPKLSLLVLGAGWKAPTGGSSSVRTNLSDLTGTGTSELAVSAAAVAKAGPFLLLASFELASVFLPLPSARAAGLSSRYAGYSENVALTASAPLKGGFSMQVGVRGGLSEVAPFPASRHLSLEVAAGHSFDGLTGAGVALLTPLLLPGAWTGARVGTAVQAAVWRLL